MQSKPSSRSALPPPSAERYWLLLGLVFLSGFAALVYELLWFRRLGLVFGNTVQAAATVLAAFMVGLAWGAHQAERWAVRTANPLRLFGLIEAGIGLYALVVPAAFALVRLGYQHAAQITPATAPVLTGFRFLMALLVLFVPTALMGASLPVLSEVALRSRERFAAKLGLLYGSNTAGATLGVLACGFVLVPQWGVQLSNLLAAAINLTVGGMALVIGRQIPARVTGPDAPAPRPSRAVAGYLAVAAGCGGLALAFETIWFRALTLVLGSTAYSFAVMVGCFLFGIALGAALLGRVANQPTRANWALASALAGTGLWTLISMRLYSAAPEYFLRLLVQFDFSWNGMILTKSVLSAVFLLPLAVLSGLAFTAVVRLIRDQTESAGRAVGSAFSINALGSAAGAVLGGFVLLPAFGLERSLFVLGALAVALGLGIAWLGAGGGRPGRWVFVGGVLAGVIVVRVGAAPWDPLLLSSGPYFGARANVAGGKVRLRERLQNLELLYYREGVTATIDVKRTPDGRLYYSNGGKVEADSSPRSMVLQRMIGHLPMLFHPRPRHALNIGLGAGVTAGALTCYPDVRIEVAELEPAVTNVAAIWAPRNHDLIRRGKFMLVVNDGRNHLLVTTNRYDVITSDPFEPAVAGAANLYTVDHFQLARSRLAPNGVMAQFLPLYELSREDLRIILRSFLQVFPRTSVFFTGTDTVLLGLTGQTELRLETAAAKLANPLVRASLAEVGIDKPERVFDMLVMDIHPGDSVVPVGPVNTDDRPIIEFTAPRSALELDPDVNQQVLLEHFQPVPAHYLAGLSPAAAFEVQRGHAGLRTALWAATRRSQGDLPAAVRALREAVELAPANPIIRNELSLNLTLAAGQAQTPPAAALALYEEALRVNPTEFSAIYYFVERADPARPSAQALELMERGIAAYPDSALLLGARGKWAVAAGDYATACRDLGRAVRQMPRNADFWYDYAVALERAGRTDESEAAFARVAQLRG